MQTPTISRTAVFARRPLALAVALGISCAAGHAAPNRIVEVSDLDGSNGFAIIGLPTNPSVGHEVSAAGDVNGDGIDDVIIGDALVSPGGATYAGQSYVVFGKSGWQAPSLSLAALNGTNGFALDGGYREESGASVSAAGDVNGDGVDDLIIGAPATNWYAGRSYVVFGKKGAFARSLNLPALNGFNGFAMIAAGLGERLGGEVSGAGDVNGDGIDDMFIGAWGAEAGGHPFAGTGYVVFGRQGDYAPSLALWTLNGSNGFRLPGIDSFDYAGGHVGIAGDVNGDGIGDLIIGAPGADAGGNRDAGASYVVFGRNTGFSHQVPLSTLNGSNGFTMNGTAVRDYAGRSVGAAGDVNGDGIDDVIVSARGRQINFRSAGEHYVVFGSDTGFPANLALPSLDGTNGFVFEGVEGLYGGHTAHGAGDVNGDGIDDVIIGATFAQRVGGDLTGAAYVVFGSRRGFAARLQTSALDGANGFRINGLKGDPFFGANVDGAGDFNDDGIEDLIIGTIEGSYVIFGRSEPPIFADGFEDSPE